MNAEFDLYTTDGWLLLLAMPAGVWVAFRLYRSGGVGGFTGAFLTAARAAACVLALLLLMEPILAVTVTSARRPLVAFLVDDSESMRIADAGLSRGDILANLMRSEAAEALEDHARVRWFAFSESVREIPRNPDSLAFDGGATDIAVALDRVREASAGDGLAAVILASDGAHNLGGQPERAAEDLGAPVYAIGIGQSTPPLDVSVTASPDVPIGYVGQELELTFSVRSSGISAQGVQTTVSGKGRVLGSRPIALTEGVREVSIRVVPDQPGDQVFRFEVPVQPGERTADNNQVLLTVPVLERRVRILLAGVPSADFAFLRRTLSNDADFEVEAVYPERSGNWPFLWRERVGRPEAFDLVVLVDVPSAVLSGGSAASLVSWVKEGGALVVVGGRNAFDAGALRSELLDILPLVPDGSGYRAIPFRVDVERSALRHPILRLSDDPPADALAWASLPPVLGYDAVSSLKPGADGLLYHPAPEGETRTPVVAAWRTGRGKVLAAAFRGFWRHGLMMVGVGGHPDLARTFWRNAVRWLVTRDDVAPLRVLPDKDGYRSGERVILRARLLDELQEPVDGARVIVSLASTPPRRILLRGRGEGGYVGETAGLAQGRYPYTALAEKGEREVANAVGEITVGRYSLEFEDLRVHRDLLQRIAARSGGRYLEADSLEAAVAGMSFSPQPHRSSYQTRLWGKRWPFFVLLALLSVEWVLRRRRGLV